MEDAYLHTCCSIVRPLHVRYHTSRGLIFDCVCSLITFLFDSDKNTDWICASSFGGNNFFSHHMSHSAFRQFSVVNITECVHSVENWFYFSKYVRGVIAVFGERFSEFC